MISRPSDQRRSPVQRAFKGLAGSPLSGADPTLVDTPVITITAIPVEPILVTPPKKRGRPPQAGVAKTAQERKAEQRVRDTRAAALEGFSADEITELKDSTVEEILQIKALKTEQGTDDATHGAYGPGRYMTDAPSGKGKLILGDEAPLAVAEKNHLEPHSFGSQQEKEDTEQGWNASSGRREVITAYHGEDGMLEGTSQLGQKESVNEFQTRHKIRGNWKYDDRDKQQLARERAHDFIASSAISTFEWVPETGAFYNEIQLNHCRQCKQLIPQEYRCIICDRVFWSLKNAVEHIVDSIGYRFARCHQ